MVRTRSQLENLSKEELIDELISVEDISSKLSDLASRFDGFLRRYEVLSSELTISKNCNRLLGERIIQLERNAVNNAQYHRRESLDINPVYKLKFKSKPWITLGLQKSISAKNKLLKNFINKKDPVLKEEFHTKYKIYRNLLSTLMKKSKQAYYEKYFERNWNNIKNTWKGIKSLINLKTATSRVPTVLSLDNGDTITNPYDIANTFNNYFISIAETT